MVLACLAIALPAAIAAPRSPAPTARSVRSAGGARLPIPFVTKVAALGGATRFQAAYGGQENSASGRLAVLYVVRGHGSGLLAAVHAEAGAADAGYRVVYVPHSWAQLHALMIKIAGQGPRWRAQGIGLAQWGPDLSASKIVIRLRSYSAAAAARLRAAYGAGWVSVSSTPMTGQWQLASNKYYDTAPFYGGDRIFTSSNGECTSAFTMLGNANPANHWVITAGHCGRNTWYTNWTSRFEVGPTSTDYHVGYGGSTYDDVQTIGPADAWGSVWGSTGTYVPYVPFLPGAGAPICFDGATPKPDSSSGLECGVGVINPIAGCITFSGGLTDCNLGQAYDANREVCLAGDSGGPVFQRVGTSSQVKAIGLIVGFGQGGHGCAYLNISGILDTTNTHLDTNASG
jgi:hypothetical protein